MTSHPYSDNFLGLDDDFNGNQDWNSKYASQFFTDDLQDDPQPDAKDGLTPVTSTIPDQQLSINPQNLQKPTQSQTQTSNQSLPYLSVPHEPNSAASSASESSHSSSNDSPAQDKNDPSSAISSSDRPTAMQSDPFAAVKDEDMLGDNNLGDFSYNQSGLSLSSLPGLDALSIAGDASAFDFTDKSPSANFDSSFFGTKSSTRDLTSQPFPPQNNQNMQSPKTIHPSATWRLGSESREESPNDSAMMNSNESSPFQMTGHSPLPHNMEGMGSMLAASNTGAPPAAFSTAGATMNSMAPAAPLVNSMSPTQTPLALGGKWPCRLDVETAPDKSRVETQIPVKLTLHNPPKGIRRIHLPSYTISKPKFQQKPPWQKSEDTLELSCLLYCASAMQKEGVPERAFVRGESEEVPTRKDELPTVHAPAPKEVDENDPDRPLNGGPVAICPGCVVRERKRAARKKTKKQEEEEEWAKEEAKRVIVFNCAEVRDWCVPESKETPVREHDSTLDKVVVNAPMRIACYCRHQNEKVGFQVLFTLRKHDGNIVAQQLSQSIMITDDHKQPMPHAGMASGMPLAHQIANGMIPAQAYSYVQQPMAFRSCWSTNDIRLLGVNQELARQLQSSHQPSETTTASTTPKNLSRPASPTLPSGQPGQKKRRSGGPSMSRASSGLTMTQIETRRSPANAGLGNVGSGPPSAGFNFTSPTSSGFGPVLDQSLQQNQIRTPTSYPSGPPTPGAAPANFGLSSQGEDPNKFFSAPTSQHPSRAASPSSNTRLPFRHAPMHNTAVQHQHQQQHQVPSHASQAAFALSHLPPNINLNRPPIIKRLIPPTSHRAGGEDITILGEGFCPGVEVMFGDTVALKTTLWGEDALVARAPPSPVVGAVTVMFKHQHPSAPSALQKMTSLMPKELVSFYYHADEGAGGSFATGRVMQQQQQQQGQQAVIAQPQPQNSMQFAGFHGQAQARAQARARAQAHAVQHQHTSSMPNSPGLENGGQSTGSPMDFFGRTGPTTFGAAAGFVGPRANGGHGMG